MWERSCRVLAWLHRKIARIVGGCIGWIWALQSRVRLPHKLLLLFLLMGGLAVWCAFFFPSGFARWAMWGEENQRILGNEGVWGSGLKIGFMAWVVAAMCGVAALFAEIRHKSSLWILKAAWAAWALLFLAALRWALLAPAVLNGKDYIIFSNLDRNAIWTAAFGYGALALIIPLLTLLGLGLASTRRWYLREEATFSQIGDRVVESLRTGGRDPQFRSSIYWATGVFLAVIILPLIIRGCGWEEPYGLIKGSGEPQIQVVTIKKKQPKKEKKMIVSAWSPYIFTRMKIDDAKVMAELTEMTMDTYEIQTEEKSGKLGKGGGKTGGWPEGMENAVVRFIRLEYRGGDWNQDMGKSADYNLLVRFHQVTGFPIARDTESRTIERLRLFPKHKAPPFVFLTGMRGIDINDREVKTLRWYLEEEGGMLFIDNGGGHFDSSVRRILSRVLPGKPLVDISNDDIIFQQPYLFPDGAPPFWHHAGTRASGIKIDGRWAVFYHPGDINDAWKDGHSGASKEVADQAYKLGINVMYYAFNTYHKRHYESGKR